jgi:DNA polymerase-3 subunit gamma/tau
MSHQVLARKWRPREFGSLVGQEHVVRALSHALATGRLHHAYLFTGTRGVGKTTIARILAKSLNCETGLTAQPCGRCRACVEIDEGRFPDYLELDAASNRGVDEMAQLLDNAVYAPVSGRFKVYVIDEVHMLSTHAFNAMLKTLEEPPPHVVFILATTDPQKVPVTVLSRCLQFNLKNMPAAAVAQHLARVLQAEGVDFEPAALSLIGRAAAGSMRDALSLLDQAIAFCGGRVGEAPVRDMLGVVDRRWLARVLDALVDGDGRALVAVADEMLSNNAPFARTLADLAALLQRIALAQVGAVGDDEDPAALQRYAAAFAPEDLQVYYQVVIHGARDLPLAPDEHAGFSMTLLRLLAFRPSGDDAEGPRMVRPEPVAQGVAAARAATQPAVPARVAAGVPAHPRAVPGRPPMERAPMEQPATERPGNGRPAAPPESAATVPAREFDGDWTALASSVPVSGFARQFMQQSELLEHDGLSLRVRVPIKPLAEPTTVNKVREALSAWFGAPVRIAVEVGAVGSTTAAAVASQQKSQRLEQARAALEADPFVQTLLTDFGGRIVPDSVRPLDP